MRVRFLGDLSVFDADMRDMMADLEKESSAGTGMHLNIAINYGGRDEIVHEYNLYSQDYCGCIYSYNERKKRD